MAESTIWEHKVCDLGTDESAWARRLDSLGERGWELVGLLSGVSPKGRRGGGAQESLFSPRAVLKRPRQAPKSALESRLEANLR